MDDEFDFMKPAKVYFMDTNLSSPVLDVEIAETKQLLTDYRSWITKSSAAKGLSRFRRNEIAFFRKLCKHRGWKSADLIKVDLLTPDLYPDIEDEMLITPEGHVGLYEEAKEICKIMEAAVADGLEARGLPREGIEGTSDTLCTEENKPLRVAYEEFCNFYGRAESRTKLSENVWTLGSIGNVKCWVTSRFALLELKGTLYASSPNQLLMLKDKLATRFMLLEHVDPLRLGSELKGHLRDLFAWQDMTLRVYGNDAYTLLKAVEPVFKTRVFHIIDYGVFGDDSAYASMQVKMLKKETEILSGTSKQPVSMPALFEMVERIENIDHLIELFGCQKSCGHPTINPRKGGLSAAAEALAPDTTSFEDAQNLRNVFCHIILTSYIEKKGSWPPLKFLKPGLRLELLSVRQERSVSYHSYPLDEWTYVEWGQMFVLDEFENFLEAMDDKAISLKRSQKHLTWDDGHPDTQRRLLLEVLRREDIDIGEIIRRVSARDIPYDWFIVSLYPKEREFKLDPRMFAMLVLEMRCFFTCIEANIAENVFRFMPQQTMTKSQTQIQERFLNFTDPARDQNFLTLFIEIDLSRWNLKWRELTIHMLGHDMNNMFGVKGTFTVTHWFFSLCQIMVRVGGLRPEGIEKDDPPTSDLAWTGHLGGFEGLNQKLWTAATYAMVEMALIPLLLSGKIKSYELIGQGDNQVLRLAISKTDKSDRETLVGIRDDVNARLETTCASVGQTVKPEENTFSTEGVTYSKKWLIRGVEKQTTLKEMSRLFPVTSSDFPSTTSNAAAIMAGAVAGADGAKHTLCCAVVGWYHTARYLLAASKGFTIHGNKGPRFNRRQVLAALIIPPSMGGLIGTPIASFLYKGGSDSLGKEISSLRLLAESSNEAGSIAGRSLRGTEEKYCFDPEPKIEILIDNPYGLPLSKKTSPLGQVSHLTLEAFRDNVVNKSIRPLLDRAVESAEAVLKSDILSVTPLNPVLAHDLFEASGFGTVKEMRKMFLNTRTVQAVAQWVNPDITHNFLRADINDMRWFLDFLKGLPTVKYSGANSYVICENARSSWGVKLHGVTNYQPLDCYHLSNTVRHPSSIKWSAHAGQDLLNVRGPISGYIGTATTAKRSSHGWKIVDSGAPSRAMGKLQAVRSQANGNLHFNELLDRIGLTRTNCRLSVITDVLDKIVGGSLSHKYVSTIRSMAASYIGPLNFITHIRLDTDSIGKVSGGSENFAVMTQEHMIFTETGAKLLYVHKGVCSGELILETKDMIPIPDDALVAQAPQFETASLPRTKLLYTPDLLLRRTYDTTVRTVPRGSIASAADYNLSSMIDHGFVGFFVELLRDKSVAKVLSDTRGTASIPTKLQIDIAEAHSMGVIRLAKCISKAIWISSLRDTFRTLHMHAERWDEALFMVHNISVCVRACASYLKHPMCHSHPDTASIRGSTLRYGSQFSIQKRMEARVKREIVRIYQDLNHKFWTDDIPVFSSENSMSIVESVSVAAIKKIYPLYISGDRRARNFSSLLSSYTRLPRKLLTPEKQLETLRMRLDKLSSVYKKAGDLILASDILSVSHLKGLLVFLDDAKTLMRHARNSATESGVIRPRHIKLGHIPLLSEQTTCLDCLPTPRSKHEMLWEKNSVRKHGGVSSAGYTWLPIIANLRILKQVLIIGSGNGGLADLLLSAYDTHVTGLDLESDMPREAATLLNYLPVGVQTSHSQRYTQSDYSLSTTGNWFDEDVRNVVLTNIFTPTTVFIDVTEESSSLGTACLHTLSHELVDSLITRFLGTEEQFRTFCSDIPEKYSVRSWTSGRTHHSLEMLVEIRKGKHLFFHTCGARKFTHEYLSDNAHSAIPDRPLELIEAATLSVLSNTELVSLQYAHDEMKSLCKSLLNKPKNRQLLYRDRMNLIWAHITLEMAISSDPVKLLQDWISDEIVETEIVRFPLREGLVTHLLRYVSRLRARFPV